MTSERYNARESEPRWQRQWEHKAIFAAKNDDPRPKYYVLEMFPYPSGRIHIGHVRNYTLGDVLARFMRAKGYQRTAPDGLGRVRAAGGKRRDRAQGRAQGVDLRQHRGDEEAVAVDRAVARLVPGIRDLRSLLLQAPAEDVPGFPARGTGRTRAAQDQLGSGRHDRAGQRAGDRRPRLALRRAGRTARDEAVGVQDHQIFAGAAGRARYAGSLARQGAADAAQLDRPLRGHAGALRARSGDLAVRRERAEDIHDAA